MPLPIIAAAAAGGLGLAEGLFNIDAAKKQAAAMMAKAQFDKDQAAKAGQFLMFNARVAERQADRDVKMLRRSADMAQGDIERKRRLIEGAQRAGFAASGIDANFGSAAMTRIGSNLAADFDSAEINFMAELDSVTIKNNAWRQAYGFKLEAEAMKDQANFNLLAAKKAGKAGVETATIGAFLSTIKGGLSGASMGSNIVAGAPKGSSTMQVPSSSFSSASGGGGYGFAVKKR